MKARTKVSVIMTVYNEEEHIKKSVTSVLNQTYEDLELVIVNDGSNDRTQEILENEFNDRRIKIFNQENKGRVKALNQAVKLSTGEYIAILDADDYCLPERLRKQVEFLDRNPDVALVGTAYYRYDEIRREKWIRKYPTKDEKIRKEMSKYIPLAHSSVMIRKFCLEEVGCYNEEFDTLQDMELFIRIAKKFKLANLDEPLIIRNIRSDSFFHRSFKQSDRNRLLVRLNLKAIKELSLPIRYYFFPLGRIVYFRLPNNFKRMVRRIFSSIDEENIK
ncbi:putative glycosyltransferase EpsE [subsurface metagenome]